MPQINIMPFTTNCFLLSNNIPMNPVLKFGLWPVSTGRHHLRWRIQNITYWSESTFFIISMRRLHTLIWFTIYTIGLLVIWSLFEYNSGVDAGIFEIQNQIQNVRHLQTFSPFVTVSWFISDSCPCLFREVRRLNSVIG